MVQFFRIAGIICIAYYVLIVLYAGITTDFSVIWPVFSAGCFLAAFLIRTGKWQALPAAIRKGTVVVLAAGCCLFFVLLVNVIRGMTLRTEAGPDYVIVLGAQVRGDVPSLSLRYRLDEAARVAEQYPEARLILSGGKGGGENITEAECMRRYLTEKGLSADRILLEDRSTTTLENLRYSDEAYDCAERPCGLVSNGFHIYRAVLIAKKYGFQNVWGIPARSSAILLVHNTVREVFALVNEWRKGTV